MKTFSAATTVVVKPILTAIVQSMGSVLLLSVLLTMAVWQLADLTDSNKPTLVQAVPIPVHSLQGPTLNRTVIHRFHHSIHLVRKPSGSVDLTSAALHSNARHYTYLFSGQVNCGKTLCPAGEISVTLTTLHNEAISRTTAIHPDGTYTVRFVFDENPQQILDWVATAKSGQRTPIEQGGRQILTNETNVAVNTPLHLEG